MIYIILIIIIVVLIYYYLQMQPPAAPISTPVMTVPPPVAESFTWDDSIQQSSIDPGVVASHQNYVANVRNYSSGPSFTQVADDNTSPIYTNFLGFYRPTYVPVGTTARQVPDIDEDVLKRNINPLSTFNF